MKKRCNDCGVKEVLPNDDLCQECREEANEFSDRVKVVYKIPWQKYDPSKPESHILYLVTDGTHVNKGFHAASPRGYAWFKETSRSPVDELLGMNVTHFTPINLPGDAP